VVQKIFIVFPGIVLVILIQVKIALYVKFRYLEIAQQDLPGHPDSGNGFLSYSANRPDAYIYSWGISTETKDPEPQRTRS